VALTVPVALTNLFPLNRYQEQHSERVIEYCDVDDLKAEYAAEIKQVLLRHRAHLGYSESQAHSMHGHSQHSASAASGIMRACCWCVLFRVLC
jgi:hypothetical protein